jgi:hypothetical protein
MVKANFLRLVPIYPRSRYNKCSYCYQSSRKIFKAHFGVLILEVNDDCLAPSNPKESCITSKTYKAVSFKRCVTCDSYTVYKMFHNEIDYYHSFQARRYAGKPCFIATTHKTVQLTTAHNQKANSTLTCYWKSIPTQKIRCSLQGQPFHCINQRMSKR